MQVTNFTVVLPGRGSVDGFAYAAASGNSSSSSTSTSGSKATGTASAPLRVVDIQVSDLQVVVAAPVSGSSTAATPPPVDLSKIVDTLPPVITLAGNAYVSVLQAERFMDPGVSAYDNIDGNSVTVITQMQLCNRPSGIEAAVATDSRPLTCGAALPTINTAVPSASNATFVLTYTARDAAGNQAVSLRRYVVVSYR